MRTGRRRVSRAERTGPRLEPAPVNVRVKIAALWASMLFVFAYVDLFSLYRLDFRADVEAGEVGGFAVNQTFLLATTVYVVIPSLMVFCVLVLRPRLNRILNIALAMVYAVSILAATIGEWTYYLLGSLIEAALLAAVVFYAWTWPKEIGQTA
jgi:membrane protein DedA with SNARE-associated domain